MSPPWAMMNSRFCVVWAWAGAPSAAATPRRPRRRWRRPSVVHVASVDRGSSFSEAELQIRRRGSGSIRQPRDPSRVLGSRADARIPDTHQIDCGRRRHRGRHQRHQHRVQPRHSWACATWCCSSAASWRPAPPASRARSFACTTPTRPKSRMAFESLKIFRNLRRGRGRRLWLRGRRLRAAWWARSTRGPGPRRGAPAAPGHHHEDDHAGRGPRYPARAARSPTSAPPRGGRLRLRRSRGHRVRLRRGRPQPRGDDRDRRRGPARCDRGRPRHRSGDAPGLSRRRRRSCSSPAPGWLAADAARPDDG